MATVLRGAVMAIQCDTIIICTQTFLLEKYNSHLMNVLDDSRGEMVRKEWWYMLTLS